MNTVQLKDLLEGDNYDWDIIKFLKRNVDNYHNITTGDFINAYQVRKMLNWPNFGLKTVIKLAKIFDKEGLSLIF